MKPQLTNSPVQSHQFKRSNSMRSKTAFSNALKNRNSRVHKSYGKFSIEELGFKDEQKIQLIWSALGKFIARNIKLGKGTNIPKLGQFTFTSPEVDLNGATNPAVRDSQERFPVFLIGKDFNCHLAIQQGIASGMTTEMFGQDGQHRNQTNHFRIYGNQGQSGIIPKVKLNIFEVAALTNGAANKDECKDVIDSKIRNISEQARKGNNVDEIIPNLGRLQIRNQIAGFVFNRDIFEEARCSTAKRYNNIFGKNNWMNDRIYEANKTNYGANAEPVDMLSQYNNNFTRNASTWLRDNHRAENSFEDLKNQHTPKPKFIDSRENLNTYSDCRASRKSRAQSAITKSTNKSSAKTLSRQSQASTVLSRVPDLAPFELMNMANQINLKKPSIINYLKTSKITINMRENLSTSQIQKVLAQVGYHVAVNSLKAMLKELGFEWNGKSCSLLKLLQSVKEYINPQQSQSQSFDNRTNLVSQIRTLVPQEQEMIIEIKQKDIDCSLTDILKDLFYNSGQTMYQLFRQGTQQSTMNIDQFIKLVQIHAGDSVSDQDIEALFERVAIGKTKDRLTYKDFEDNFSHSIPTTGNIQSETLIIQKVREWMFQRQYNTKIAFDRLCRCVDRFQHQSLRRVDFHKSFIFNKVGLSAPEIDLLYDILMENQEGDVTIDQWSGKIYDDVTNPLQLIREVVHSQNINEDDLLFQMKIKIWDDPLFFKQFVDCLHSIDPSFSDGQCKALFHKLKNSTDRVEVPVMISNICGTTQDTVDYRNKLMKQLYEDVFKNEKQDELMRKLENCDKLNDGKVSPLDLQKIIFEITKQKYSEDDIQKFVRQLKKDENYKIGYLEFMDKVTSLANKDHNPFRSLMQRMAFFLEQNKISISNLLKRLSIDGSQISINKFADFLKQKIDKRRDYFELFSFAQYIDIDKDGYINEEDLRTCIRNLNSIQFFKDCNSTLNTSTFNSDHKFFVEAKQNSLSEDKILKVISQIIKSIQNQKMSILALWKKVDKQQSGMINFSQFLKGVNEIVTISGPILEKIFSIMDINQIGLVDYDKFFTVLSIEIATNIPNPEKQINDGFEWQESVIRKIREWVINNKLGSVEAFRSYDRDLTGAITKESMRKSLIEFLGIDQSEITQNRMDRLFKMLSFYKQDRIQQSDFDRLLSDQNPYLTSGTQSTQTKFKSSMGGGFTQTSVNDWKFACLQQIGLTISKKFFSVEDCFKTIVGDGNKMIFSQFQQFVNDNQALSGFNITHQLMQKIFAELDPHKKAYLSLQDWTNGFKLFNTKETMLVEFKNFVQSNFISLDSTYAFLQQHGISQQSINLETLQKAVISIFGSRRAPQYDVHHIFRQIAGSKNSFTKSDLEKEFKDLQFQGTQYIKLKQSMSEQTLHKSSSQLKATKPTITNVATSKWEADVLDKLKLLIKQSGKPLDCIFKNFDTNNNGLISEKEFVKVIKSLSMSLSDMDISKIMNRVDANQDGVISYSEFVAKLRNDPQFDIRMKQRASNKLANIKQQMVHHMVSITKAFSMFDSTNSQILTFLDFDKLLKELSKLSGDEVPCYMVVKDLFDAIDSKQDQLIDVQEWSVAFNTLEATDPKLAIKTTSVALWQNSFEAKQIMQCMHRNRKILLQRFQKFSTHSDHNGEAKYITFEQARKALDPLITSNFKKMISNRKLDCLLSTAQVVTKISNYPDIKLYDFLLIIPQ